jgi:tripartite-type tricarboxylate transporter receptor subunit TctC
MYRNGAISALSLLAVSLSAPVQAAEPFYKGMTLTIVINFAAGGPTDIEGRLVARHLGKHIDGRPNVIAQNRPGAGGMTGTNFLGKIAPKDGSVLGYLTSAAWPAVSNPEKFEVDFRDYQFIAYQPGTSVYYVRTDVAPGLKTATDIARATGLVPGGLSKANAKDVGMRLTLDMLGVPYKYVTGYGSNQPARLAFERGEINFFVESPPAYRATVVPSLVNTGVAIPLFYDTVFNGETYPVPKQIADLGILPFHELYEKLKGSKPSGELWEAYLTITTLRGAMQRIAALPPGTKEGAAQALHAAFEKLNGDPAFAQESMKAIGFVPDFEAGPQVQRQVQQALTIKPEVKRFVDNYAGAE